jgi:hypothetical protein
MELRSIEAEVNGEKLKYTNLATRRSQPRYGFLRTADWDFFTASTGTKPGYLENISEGGCLFRTSEPIEHRRWIRFIVKDSTENLHLVLVGRVVRREDKMESWDEQNVTLHRYGVEFIQPLNPMVLSQIKKLQMNCAVCGDASAQIPDAIDSDVVYCVLCHLRRACHHLLSNDTFDEGA